MSSLLNLALESLGPASANAKIKAMLTQSPLTAAIIKSAISEYTKQQDLNPQTVVLLCKLLTLASASVPRAEKNETLTGLTPVIHTFQIGDFGPVFVKFAENVENHLSSVSFKYTKSELVKYHFYIGLYKLNDFDFAAADRHLAEAFRITPSTQEMFSKKQIILSRLIVTRMVRGIPPSVALLQKYSLRQFEPLLASYKNGNFRQFHVDIMPLAEQLVQAQLYTIMTKWTRISMLRNLIRNIWAGRNQRILSFEELLLGFRFAGLEDWDLIQVENCIVGMIEQRIILGYVSHGTGLILAKKDPFPRIAN
ncbi:MAG: hypothetical protein SGCHY_000948, partial [Lobulomycetales sp.]